MRVACVTRYHLVDVLLSEIGLATNDVPLEPLQ